MSDEKQLNLEQAREENKLEEFVEQNPSKGDKHMFDNLFTAMVKTKPVSD